MSGVISADGTQWERCNDTRCGHKWVRLEDLHYERPSAEYKHGRDLCRTCKGRSLVKELRG